MFTNRKNEDDSDDNDDKSSEATYIDMPEDKSLLIENTSTTIKKIENQPERKSQVPPFNIELDYGEKSSPDRFAFDAYEAYRIRLISFANGAIYHAVKNKKAGVIPDIKNLVSRKCKELDEFKRKTKGKEVFFETELYQFYNKELPDVSGLTPKQIAMAEAMYVWQEAPHPKQRSTKYVRDLGDKGQLVIEQIETLRSSELTYAQKAELVRIHTEETQPQWFTALDPWVKRVLKEIVPKKVEDSDWSNYQKFHPTILRHIPGEANATRHQLKVTHVPKQKDKNREGPPNSHIHDSKGIENKENKSTVTPDSEEILLSDTIAIRQGAPSSFEMKNKGERKKSAFTALHQMLEAERHQAMTAFLKFWGKNYAAYKLPKMPILLGGLLSTEGVLVTILDFTNMSGNKDNNRMMYTDKKEAVKTLNVNDPNQTIFDLNIGINSWSKRAPGIDKTFCNFIVTFKHEMRRLADHANEIDPQTGIHSERINRLDELDHALWALDSLKRRNPNPYERNHNLYTAALYDVTTRLMVGLSTGNCKSSKDRKGIEFIMADAMLIYFAEQKARGEKKLHYPKLTDTGESRTRFVEIFCELYASGHQLLIAHDNSPGCPGIKAGDILDADMMEKLKSMQEKASFDKPQANSTSSDNKSSPSPARNRCNVYDLSNQIADFNKPGSFWKKHKKTVKKWVIPAAMVILIIVSIVLMATGGLSPLGVIGAVGAAKLGAAAVGVGGVMNTSLMAGGAAAVVSAGCAAYDAYEERMDKQKTFKAQIAKFKNNKGIAKAPDDPVLEDKNNISVRTKETTSKLLQTKTSIKTKKNHKTQPSTTPLTPPTPVPPFNSSSSSSSLETDSARNSSSSSPKTNSAERGYHGKGGGRR